VGGDAGSKQQHGIVGTLAEGVGKERRGARPVPLAEGLPPGVIEFDDAGLRLERGTAEKSKDDGRGQNGRAPGPRATCRKLTPCSFGTPGSASIARSSTPNSNVRYARRRASPTSHGGSRSRSAGTENAWPYEPTHRRREARPGLREDSRVSRSLRRVAGSFVPTRRLRYRRPARTMERATERYS
jgi:hypothetical protein